MKTRILIAAALLICLTIGDADAGFRVFVARGGAGSSGGPSFTDCATDGGSMLYCQDFEATGGGNPDAETPAMTTSFGPNADYATTPAPFEGAQSARRTSGLLEDVSAWTATTGQHWIQFVISIDSGAGNFQDVFRSKRSTTNGAPSLLNSNIDGSTYNLWLFCNGDFDAGENVVGSSALNFGDAYTVKIDWDESNEEGELFACPFTPGVTDPFAPCTTSQGTCNGEGVDLAGMDGFIFSNVNMTVDVIFFSTSDLSP